MQLRLKSVPCASLGVVVVVAAAAAAAAAAARARVQGQGELRSSKTCARARARACGGGGGGGSGLNGDGEQSSEDVRTRNLRVPRRCGSARRSSADGEALPPRRRAVADALQAPVRRHRGYRARRAIARKRSAGTKYRTQNSAQYPQFWYFVISIDAG